MSLGLDIERKLSHAIEAFAFLADATEQGMAEGIIDGADGFKADEHERLGWDDPGGIRSDGRTGGAARGGRARVRGQAGDGGGGGGLRAQDGAQAASRGAGQGASLRSGTSRAE